MSKMNLFLAISAYEDENPTNIPSKNVFKWAVDHQGISAEEPHSGSIKLAPGQSMSLFSGQVSISDDNTTTYDISVKSGTTNTYVLKHNSGAAPQFRASRSLGIDATSQVTVSKNSNLLTITASGGTLMNTTALVVGDEVELGTVFNIQNQGKFKILAKTSNSFIIENPVGVAETLILGIDFADQIRAYSSSGVQTGDKVAINSGFSTITQGTYEITSVSDNRIEFYSLKTLPAESNIAERLDIYNQSKRFTYIESDKKIDISINNASVGKIEPIQFGTKLKPGMFMFTSNMFSAQITNNTEETATVFFATAE